MIRKIGKVLYNTEEAQIVKKNTFSYYGDPNGYEETLCTTPKGHYFLYVNGGQTSKQPKEKIIPLRKERAINFLNA